MPELEEHRGIHWVHALSALILLAAGLVLYSQYLSVLLGRRDDYRFYHLLASVLFLVPLFFTGRDLKAAYEARKIDVKIFSVIFTLYFIIWFSITGVMILLNEFSPTAFGESFLFLHQVLTLLFIPFLIAHVVNNFFP